MVNVDGTDERLLVTTVHGDYNLMNVSYWTTFQILSAGDEIVFTSDDLGYSQIFSMGVEGTQEKRLMDRLEGAGFLIWSPDGRYIVFLSLERGFEYDIYAMGEDSGSILKLATGSDVSWSPIKR